MNSDGCLKGISPIPEQNEGVFYEVPGADLHLVGANAPNTRRSRMHSGSPGCSETMREISASLSQLWLAVNSSDFQLRGPFGDTRTTGKVRRWAQIKGSDGPA